MAKLYRNKEGKKLYPVCSHDRIMVAYYDNEADYEEVERVEEALAAFDRYVINGIVYATWEEGQLIKDYVWAYNARH